ncbi:MAG TPA: alkane 1-monooxygenase [Microscillaceae bacterium]|jgi:alkane 1-monooxygenase|nr:alkane 1-monooxygenase [Microscillaceae bacterium]
MSIFKKLAFLWAFSLPAVVLLSYYALGGGYWLFAGVVYAYGIIPILDTIVGRDPANVSAGDVPVLSNDKYFAVIAHLLSYITFFFVIWGAYLLVTEPLNFFQATGLVITIGVINSGGINLAHELGHKKNRFNQIVAQAVLMTSAYMHFFIEHNKGHHVHVATPLDPATSKKGQTLYQFLQQSIVGSFRSAWNIEKRRLEREGHSVWSWRNAMLWYVALPVVFCGVLTLSLWPLNANALWMVPIYFVVQAYIAFSSLECVNYIEHYGITRREIAPGKYERVNPLHSWNANHLVSNLVLLQLQRHSDHHAFAARPYQVLRHFDESPQLPYGYPVMILMSMIPPLWFKVMDKRLEEWQSNAYDADHIAKVVKAFA